MQKYQGQLYQVLNQANYFFMQKMAHNIAKASEVIAKDKKIDIVMNKEACFYYASDMEITKFVIERMDQNFDKEKKQQAALEKQEQDKALAAATEKATEALKAEANTEKAAK